MSVLDTGLFQHLAYYHYVNIEHYISDRAIKDTNYWVDMTHWDHWVNWIKENDWSLQELYDTHSMDHLDSNPEKKWLRIPHTHQMITPVRDQLNTYEY